MRLKTSNTLIVVFFLILISSPISPVHAFPLPTPADPIQVGQIGGVTTSVVFDGSHIFFNVGPRVVRMELPATSPASPSQPGTYSSILPGIPVDIKLANGFIYVAMGTAGVAIIDATSMQVVTSQALPANDFANAVAAAQLNSYLYVAAGSSGIVIYNLGPDKNELAYSGSTVFSSPTRIITDVEITRSGSEEDLYASANNQAALPENRGGVVKFDISSSPFLGAADKKYEQIDVNALATFSSNVYAASDGALYILNTSTLGLTGSLSSTHSGSQINITQDGNTAYLIGSAGVDVVNVINPTGPTLLSSSPFIPQSPTVNLASVVITGDPHIYLYIADFNSGLSIASSPQNAPQNISPNNPSNILFQPPISHVVAGTATQVYSDTGPSVSITTVNTSNINNLSLVGSGAVPFFPIDSIAASHNFLLATTGTFGLFRYQASDGSEPTSQEPFLTSGGAYGLSVSWPNVAIAAGKGGISVVNIDGPMSLVGNTLDLPSFDSDFRKVDWEGDFAFIVDNDGNFRIYDLSDPTGPVPTNGFLTESGLIDVKVSGNFAFLACGSGGIKVADVTDKANPTFISGAVYSTAPGVAQSLAIFKNYLFVAAGSSGVVVLSIQPDGHLTYVTTINISDSAVNLDLVPGAYLYIASQNGGLTAVKTPLIMTDINYFPVVKK